MKVNEIMGIFLINVGVNASHGGLKSPLFEDGSFEFIPIPEAKKGIHSYPDCPLLPRYIDLKSPNQRDLLNFIPKKYWMLRVHNDPEFDTFTYGDYPTLSPRAANLKRANIGDFLFFFARLELWKDGKFTGKAGFYLIGFFEIERILKNVTKRPTHSQLEVFGNNAHIKRGLSDPKYWDGFWVFKGSKKSKLFKRAVPITREFINTVLTNSNKGNLIFPPNRTELQVIGSYTRAARVIENGKEPLFWEFINKAC